jgi:hypothetical protein
MKNKTEKTLAEAIHSMFKNDPDVLGIAHGKPHFPTFDPSHKFQHQFEEIIDRFALKINEAGLEHYEPLRSAFYDIHSYTFITDSRFLIDFEAKCKSMAVPLTEVEQAKKIIWDLSESVKKESGDERSVGWVDVAAMRDVTTNANNRRPKREAPFTGGGPAPDPRELILK